MTPDLLQFVLGFSGLAVFAYALWLKVGQELSEWQEWNKEDRCGK